MVFRINVIKCSEHSNALLILVETVATDRGTNANEKQYNFTEFLIFVIPKTLQVSFIVSSIKNFINNL